MYTRDIPVGQWRAFLRGFNREHAGRAVNLAVELPRTGMMPAARGLPLLGVTLEWTDEGDGRVEISAGGLGDGGDAAGHVTHVVPRPRRISLTEDDGEDRSLLIEAGDGALALLGLVRRPMSAWR